MTPETYEQIKDAYRRMASEARYHAAAPSDGHGNITIPISEINVEADAEMYVSQWWQQENSQDYFIGCPDWSGRPALIYLIEAAKALCGVQNSLAADLCRMAAEELDTLSKERGNFRL